MSSVNPQFAAKHIAGLLEGDPVMARLVKEHIPEARLMGVLELTPPEPEVFAAETFEDAFPDWTTAQLREAMQLWLIENPPSEGAINPTA